MKKLLTLLILLFAFLKGDTLTPPPFPDYGYIIGSSQNDVMLQPENNILQLKKGWKMYGYDAGVKDVNKTFGSLLNIVNIVWYFNENEMKWYAYSPDPEIMKTIQNNSATEGVLSSIPSYSGFWVYSYMDYNVTLNPDYNVPQEVIVSNVSTDENFTLTSGELEIYVTPLDIDGNLISDNITKSNFKFQNVALYDLNGTKITDVNMSVKDIYIHTTTTDGVVGNYVVLSIDASGSMSTSDPNGLRIDASKDLINLISDNTYMAIMTFGDGVSSGMNASKLLVNFTDNKTSLIDALDEVTSYGDTPLYDSIIDAINLLKDVPYQVNKSVIVFTDGEDTSSTHTPEDVINLANQYGITIYTIGLGDSVDENTLKEIADKTGGLYKFAQSADELTDVFTKIGATSVKGYVDVVGLASYDNVKPGEYIIKGDLIFEILGKSVTSSFENTVNIQ